MSLGEFIISLLRLKRSLPHATPVKMGVIVEGKMYAIDDVTLSTYRDSGMTSRVAWINTKEY